MKNRLIGFIAVLFLIFMASFFSTMTFASVTPDMTAKIQIHENYSKIPLYFIQNDGQMNKKVKYYEKGSRHAMFFTEEGVYLSLTVRQEQEAISQKSEGRNKIQGTSRTIVPLIGNFEEKEGRGKMEEVAGKYKIQNGKYNVQNPKSKLSTDNSQPVAFHLVKFIPIGANKHPEIFAEGLQEGKVNYFIGNNQEKWKTNIPTYSTVVYKNIYDGIDLKFYGNNHQLEYDIIVKPGADPSKVRFAYEGIENLRVNDNGDLEIVLNSSPLLRGGGGVSERAQQKPVNEQQPPVPPFANGNLRNDGSASSFAKTQDMLEPSYTSSRLGETECTQQKIIQKKPYVYQEIDGKKVEIEGRFEIQEAQGKKKELQSIYSKYSNPKSKIQNPKFIYSFKVASYDRRHLLIIDPTLKYSTYLGGDSYECGYAITVDNSGIAYVTGYTDSTNFPTSSAYQGIKGESKFGYVSSVDTFVTKITTSGNSLVYSTYLGGDGDDSGYSIAVDDSGCAYVTGKTSSTNFPTSSAYDDSNAKGNLQAFVTKLNDSGSSLIYSTYLGGSYYDEGYGIAVDSSGNAYVTGYTDSPDFPTLSAYQESLAGGGHTGYTGYKDVFVTKLDTNGSSLVYSTYLGGSSNDYGCSIAVDGSGNAYITGYTESANFPTFSAYQGSKAGSTDVFITKLDVSGGILKYSTYLGGSSYDLGYAISLDESGNAYVTGYTGSSNFPTSFAYQGGIAGEADVFITKLNDSGSILSYSTYLGGSDFDAGYGIAVDSSGNAFVTGSTDSTDFPTVSAYQENRQSYYDVFVVKLDASGYSLSYSTYLGGNGEDVGHGIAVDGSDNAYITGWTGSTNFPMTSAYQGSNAGGMTDVFVAKISSESTTPTRSPTPSPRPTPSDVTVPTGSISINSDASFTNSTNVTLNLSAKDNSGVTGYYLSDESAPPTASTSGWKSVASATSYNTNVSYDLDNGDGSKTIYAWYKDAAGNLSSAVSDSITLDKKSPTVTITIPTSDSTYTATSSTINLGGNVLDSTSGVSSLKWSSNRGNSGTAEGTTSWNVSGISLASGINMLTVTAMDRAGNTGTDTITVRHTVSMGGGVILGYVYDVNYGPLRGVTVSINGDEYLDYTETDKDGYYEFEDLLVGDFTLTYEKDSFETQTQEVRLEEDESHVVDDIFMEEVEKGRIYGHVVDISGEPIESVQLTLKGLVTKISRREATDADGFFEFNNLDVDKYVINAKKWRYRKTKIIVNLEEKESREVEIEMRRTTKRIKKLLMKEVYNNKNLR